MAVQARKCFRCPAMVYDLMHVGTKRLAAIDATPRADGNVMVDLEAGTYTLTGRDLREGHKSQTPRYVNHYATCPNAEQFRR